MRVRTLLSDIGIVQVRSHESSEGTGRSAEGRRRACARDGNDATQKGGGRM